MLERAITVGLMMQNDTCGVLFCKKCSILIQDEWRVQARGCKPAGES